MRKSYRVHVGLNGVYNGDDEFMAGESIMFSGPANKVPAGYLIEDGSAVGRVAYATLFAAIGTTYGAGDGATTFNLPDSRGEFWRGLDLGRGVDPGRAIGSAQLDALEQHGHRVEGTANNQGNSTGYEVARITPSSTPGDKTGTGAAPTVWRDDQVTLGVGGRFAAETRGRNIAKIPLIKY